jgi:outer membrane lipase/esterase
MKAFTRTALAAALALGVAAPAMAQFSGVYFFGDSLTDMGSYKPVLPPGTGLFTTNPGPVWAQPFAQAFGYNATPANQGGNDYAYGGARVTQLPGYPDTAPTGAAVPVSTQVQQLIAKGPLNGSAIYAVWAGANDLFTQVTALSNGSITASQAQANLGLAATQLAQQVGALRGQGANYIMVGNLPDPGKTPAFAGNPLASSVSALAGLFNSTLFSALDASGIPVIRLNAQGLLNEIVANPSTYGFVNATSPACGATPSLVCTSANFVAPNAANTYVFADGVHPTTAAHAIVAQYAASVVLAPQQVGVLAEAPLATEQANWRALDGRMFSSINTRPMGKFEAWAAYDYSSQDFDSGFMTNGDANLNSIVVGGDIKLSPHLIAGMMAGYTQNKGDYGSAGYKLNQTTGTVYVGWGDGPWYAGATLGGSDLDYSDVHRDITLGALTRTESGSTQGYTMTGRLLGGYWFTYEDWLHGPTAKWTYQDIKVRAYQEQGSSSTTMAFNQQDRNSSILSLGWQASGKIANVRPYAKVTWEYEMEDQMRYVQASVYGMGGGFSMPVYQPDSNWFNFNLGAAADFGKVTGYIAGSATAGKSDGDSYAITVGVRIPM